MLEFIEHGRLADTPVETVTLSYGQRQKSRQRVVLDSGKEAGIFLGHGCRLYDGDVLISRDQACCLRVLEALEPLTTVISDDPRALARASYHLGNRHVPIQLGDQWIRFERDHVLDDMIRTLDLNPLHEIVAFEPEKGAYNKLTHAPQHSHAFDTASSGKLR